MCVPYEIQIRKKHSRGDSSTEEERAMIKVVCDCVAKFGSPPCCAAGEQVLARLADHKLDAEASWRTDLELSVVVQEDSPELTRKTSFPRPCGRMQG